MSQAEELLSLLSETIPEHTHPVVDSDSYFLIDPVTRKIENMSRKDLILMQRDHNSERYTFQLPRYIEGHDMSLCNRVKCYFNNIEHDVEADTHIEHPDLVELTDLRVNPEDETSVICSWLITRQSTWYEGSLGFFLQYLCVDDEGNETYEWNTDEFTAVTVKKTKHHDEAAILEYTAIFEQWRERIFGAGDSVKSELIALTEEKLEAITTEGSKQVESVTSTGSAQVKAIANEGMRVLNTIPEDYTAMSGQVEMLSNFAGPVIRQEVEGESISVKDSARMPLLGLQMFGKSSQKTTKGYQLFDDTGMITKTDGGATVTKNPDHSFTISGSGMIDTVFNHTVNLTHAETVKLLKSGMLKLKCEQKTHPYFIVRLNVQNSNVLSVSNLSEAESEAEILQEWLDDESSYLRYTFYGVLDANIVPGTIKPMLYQDGDGTWEPFTGGQPSPNPEYPQEIVSVENPTSYIYSKNLADLTEGINTCLTEENGVYTFTKVDNNQRFSGTIPIFIPANTPFTVSANILESTKDTVTLPFYFRDKDGVSYYVNSNGTPLLRTYDKDMVSLRFYIQTTDADKSYVKFNNFQIEIGKVATEYESPTKCQTITMSTKLPGIPVSSGGNYIDENGQQYIVNYRDWERGVDVQRVYKYEVTGEESWYLSNLQNFSDEGYYRYDVNTTCYYGALMTNVLCSHFRYEAANNKGAWALDQEAYLSLRIIAQYSSVAKLKTFLAEQYTNGTPVTFQYVLWHPIETPIPEEELQAYRALRTNYPNTTILNDSGANMKLAYATDTKTYIDNKFAELQAALTKES